MYRHIMIVVDDDPVSLAGIDDGLELAKVHGAKVLFFHVLPAFTLAISPGEWMPLDPGDPEPHERHVQARGARMLATAQSLASEQAIPSAGSLGRGPDAGRCVAQAAHEHSCDLIVVSAYGEGTLQRLLHGSLVTGLLPLTPVPMLVCVRHERTTTSAEPWFSVDA